MSDMNNEGAVRLKAFDAGKLRKLRGDLSVALACGKVQAETGVTIHPNTWAMYEEGPTVPGGAKLAAIAAAFKITIDQLFR